MDYMFGRMALGFLKVISWAALIIGLLIAFGSASGSFYYFARQDLGIALPAAYFGMIPGLFLALIAMISLAFLDHIAATIDSAIWAKRTFRVSQQQLAVSKEALKLGKLVHAAQAPTEELAAGAAQPNGDGSGWRFSLPGFLKRKSRGETPQEGVQRRQPQLTAETNDPSTGQQDLIKENDQASASIEQENELPLKLMPEASPSTSATNGAPPVTLVAKPNGAE